MVPDSETITVTDSDTITPLINVMAPVAEFSAGSLGFGGADGSQTLTVSDIGLASLTIGFGDNLTRLAFCDFADRLLEQRNVVLDDAALRRRLHIDDYLHRLVARDRYRHADVHRQCRLEQSHERPHRDPNFTQSITLNGSGSSTAPPPPPPATVDVPTSGPDSETITVTDMPVVKVFYTPTVQLTISPAGPVVDWPAGDRSRLRSFRPAGGPGTPTGTVTFLNGTTTLGTITLSQGVAVLTTSTLPSGYNGITASYGGDNNFAPETSAVETVSVDVADYTVIANPSTLTIVGGPVGQHHNHSYARRIRRKRDLQLREPALLYYLHV